MEAEGTDLFSRRFVKIDLSPVIEQEKFNQPSEPRCILSQNIDGNQTTFLRLISQ